MKLRYGLLVWILLGGALPALGEQLLIRAGEGEYHGWARGSVTFETCSGTILSIGPGDRLEETDEPCPAKEPIGPGPEEAGFEEEGEEPPPA